MTGARFALVATVSAAVLGLSASASAAGTGTGPGTVTSGSAGAYSAAHCLAHVVGVSSHDYYTAGCTGHDEPELDPVSSAPGSAQNITWRAALPADGSFPVSSVGPTFWFGGTVKDTNPNKIGGQGFLELQFYPDSFTTGCTSGGGFQVKHETDVYTACSPVWTIAKRKGQIVEPAAFNGMLRDATGSGPFVMHALDIGHAHLGPVAGRCLPEQITDETSGTTSSVLVLNSPGDGPLTPAFGTQEIGNALDWGAVWDTPMAFVYEIGHSDLYGQLR